MALPVPAVARGDKVEVGQEYFQALFMRAHLCPPYDPSDPSLVRIQMSEYDFLTRALSEYLTLRKNLLEDGVELATLEMYTAPRWGSPTNTPQHGNGHTTVSGNGATGQRSTTSMAPQTDLQPSSLSHDLSAPTSDVNVTFATSESFTMPHNQDSIPSSMPQKSFPAQSANSKPHRAEHIVEQNAPEVDHIARRDQRTLEMTGFSADTSLKDIIEHIKGGMIIEIYRYNERAVRVSFLRGTDAQAFRTFARRHDIYINSKRVHVDWADRQFHLNDHLYNRIASNRATRILRLRNGKRFVTEHDIQNDMEHIHNLVIIEIKVQGNDFIVYTNSVQRCGYARTCMTSRMPYRALKLEFVPDDCAAPLPQRTHPNFFDAVQPTSQVQLKPRKSTNFYEILNSDALDDDGDCEAMQHVNRRDSAVSDYSSDICRPRSADSDAISYC